MAKAIMARLRPAQKLFPANLNPAKGSIAARLFWLSGLWLVVALAATAFLLTELYSRALDRSLADTLVFNLETLVARTLEAGSPESAEVLAADPRFGRPASGWYWRITGPDGQLLNLSGSLVGSSMPTTGETLEPGSTGSEVLTDDFGTRVRLIERRINAAGSDYVISVTGNLDEINQQAANFRSQALIVLIAVGAMLAIMSAIVGRVALRPVGRLRHAIESVRGGGAERIAGDYPEELRPLAEELNELLRSNAEILERARGQVGNLAHGLKTPLAVLQNEAAANRGAFAKTVTEETARMSGMVSNYLDRARLSARTAIVGQRADAGEVLDRMVRVMDKLHARIDVDYAGPTGAAVWFRGEEADFEEIAGNLLDNACKWAKGRVHVELGHVASGGDRRLRLVIEDDGPGLTVEEREKVLRRGVRLDEKVPGSGLGLDIVKELVDVYGGQLELSDAGLGGLGAIIELPAVQESR